MDRTASHGLRKWRPCWWRRRPGPWLQDPDGTNPGTEAAAPLRVPGPTCLCGCQTNRGTQRLKPRCWSLKVRACLSCLCVCMCVWKRRLGEALRLLWVHKTSWVGRSTAEQSSERHKCWHPSSTLSKLCAELSTGRCNSSCAMSHGARYGPASESKNFVSRKAEKWVATTRSQPPHSPHLTFQPW